jgi:hypothetical protein
MKRKIDRCHVVDKDGNIIIAAGIIGSFLSKVHNGPQTHVVVRYYKGFDEAMTNTDEIMTIFPLSQVFFFKTEEE